MRGRLRLYSASGFFLLLGLVILAIGIGMATLGYWPQSEAMHSAKMPAGGGSATTASSGKTSTSDLSNGTVVDATAANSSTFSNVPCK